jgi:hypothetical protein
MRIAGLAVLLGCAAAAIIWSGWGIAAHLLAVRSTKAPAPLPAQPEKPQHK